MKLGVIAALVAFALPCARADAYRLEGGRWPTRTIPYYTETAAYAWSVDTAAYAWNTSGAQAQFVKSSRANAKVLIGIRWYRHAGDATMHRVGGSIVRAEVGIQTGHDRYEMALIVAHELGHVLGLDHTSDPNQLMYASYHGQDGFGKGDRHGLERLHDVPCN
jgi:hypothetical protein